MASCKCLCTSTVIAVFLLFLSALILTVYFAYPGSQTTLNALDIRILNNDISTTWCQSQKLQSLNPKNPFNATVIPQIPHLNPNIRRRITLTHPQIPLTPENPRIQWRYYLTKDSTIDVTQCAKTNDVMSFIFRGHDVNENCIRFLTRHQHDDHSEEELYRHYKGHNPCTDITLQRFIVRVCRKSMQPMHATITTDDYYIILYQSGSPDFSYISSNVTLNTPSYDLSTSLYNCTSRNECIVPLRFASSDTVVAYLLDPGGEDATVVSSCELRVVFYCIVFIGGPVLVLISCGVVCCCCCGGVKRKRKVTQRPVEVCVEKEPLLVDREEYMIDPRLRQMGPIPGILPGEHCDVISIPGESRRLCDVMPSAPVDETGQPFDEPFQPSGFGEPPPTYEETIRNDEGKGLMEKC